MRIQLKWLMSGNVTPLEEKDDLLNPQTSILEVKGLIGIQFGFPAKEVLLVHKHVLENYSRLKDVGIVDSESAEEIVLTAHVVPQAGLESSNVPAEAQEEEEEEDDDGLLEFTHEDMITAMKMLGKDVPVGEERLEELRANAPRSAPQFLKQPQVQDVQSPPSKKPATVEASSGESTGTGGGESRSWRRLVTIFQKLEHGLRSEGVDQALAIKYPGVKNPYAYWDLRLPMDMSLQNECGGGEIVLEVFFFGDCDALDKPKFHQLVVALMDREGIRTRSVGEIREAGCMYPLVSVPLLLSVADAWDFGHRVFENFGESSLHAAASESERHRAPGLEEANVTGVGQKKGRGGKEECSVM